jgi:hypothetical protein
MQVGDEARVVEHNDSDRTPKPGGKIRRATVTEVGGIYVRVRYQETEEWPGTHFDAFYKESGWRAWDGMFSWRLESAGDPR